MRMICRRQWLKRLGLAATGLLASALPGCDGSVENPAVGDMEITAPALAGPTVTADGWTISWTRFLVHVTAVSVSGDDRVLAASATPQILDQAAPEPKTLLSAAVRTARAWEDVSLRIGPAEAGAEITLVAPVSEADRDRMTTDGLSLYVEATAAKEEVTKSLRWAFSTDTLHRDCQENAVRGLVVPPNGTDSAAIAIEGSVLFSDDLDAPATTLRADAIVSADTNADGFVTVEELRAVPLDAARAVGGAYRVGAAAAIADLGAFVEELTRHIVRSFRGAGTCTPEPAAPAE